MVSSSSTSEPRDMSCAPIVEAHTKECLEEIRNMSSKELANVIILIGRTGVGKSALLEYLTNTQGHSKNSLFPVTLKFQLECFSFSSKKFYIMDTPGFDMDNERAVFDEIIRGIEAVRPYAKIVGIMLVTRINDSRAEAFDNRLVAFVDKLCGPAYAAQVTVVTNFWNVSEPEEKTEFETRLDESLQRWRAVLGQDLKQYQHGRRYNSFGEDAGECLKWRGNSDDIKVYAKAMVNRHYGGIKLRDPVIIQELSENRSLGKTAAGRFLGIDPSPQSSTSTSASSPSQAEATTPPPTTPEPEAEEIPRPSASSRRANSNQSQSQAHPDSLGGNPFLEVSKWVGKEVIVTVIQQVLTNLSSGVTSGQGGGGFPSHLDPLSPRDHFLARGLRGDREYRTQWGQERGITLEPGSQAFGDAVRNLIIRVWPL